MKGSLFIIGVILAIVVVFVWATQIVYSGTKIGVGNVTFGDIIPLDDNLYDIGNLSNRFRFLTAVTTNTTNLRIINGSIHYTGRDVSLRFPEINSTGSSPVGAVSKLTINLTPVSNLTREGSSTFLISLSPSYTNGAVDRARANFQIDVNNPTQGQGGTEAFFTIRSVNSTGQLAETIKIGHGDFYFGIPERSFGGMVQSVNWIPLADNRYDLGAPAVLDEIGQETYPARRWRDLYLAGNIIGQASPTYFNVSKDKSEFLIGLNTSIFNSTTFSIYNESSKKMIINSTGLYTGKDGYQLTNSDGRLVFPASSHFQQSFEKIGTSKAYLDELNSTLNVGLGVSVLQVYHLTVKNSNTSNVQLQLELWRDDASLLVWSEHNISAGTDAIVEMTTLRGIETPGIHKYAIKAGADKHGLTVQGTIFGISRSWSFAKQF